MKAIFLMSLVVALSISGCVEKQVTQPVPISTPISLFTSTPIPTAIAPIASNSTSTPVTIAVEIKGFAYNPQTITISKGTKVVWTNIDIVSHTVTIASGSGFDSGTLSQGQAFSYLFNVIGTFDYGCSIHPNMSGKVIVK